MQWREWEGEFVVRDGRSGATHLLAQASGTILVVLTQSASPLSAQEIAGHLGNGVPTDEPVTASHIERILLELERIGLVARLGA